MAHMSENEIIYHLIKWMSNFTVLRVCLLGTTYPVGTAQQKEDMCCSHCGLKKQRQKMVNGL